MLLLTGVTGYSGQYFLQELIRNQYEGPIRCIVRENSDTALLDNCGLKVEKIIGDLNDQNLLNNAMVGVDTVFHISSIFFSVNVLKAAVLNNVKRVIAVHTTGIYSKYKSASEDYKKIEDTINQIVKDNNSSVGLIILRPTMIYGHINDRNLIVFIKMVDKFRLFPVIDGGRNLLQPVNGNDLGKAYYQVLMKTEITHGDYILSGDQPITILEMFQLISSLLGKKTVFINVPLPLGVFAARILSAITAGRINYIERVQRMGENRSFDHNRAYNDFKYEPMPFSQGLRAEISQYLEKKR